MSKGLVTRNDLLTDRQGKTFADVVNDPNQPFDIVLEFIDNEDCQRRMEESELHHDRPALAGVVRELESLPAVDLFLSGVHAKHSARFWQAICSKVLFLYLAAHEREKTSSDLC
ncbi:MAG: hypothetical protein JW829_16200 [Pirellulales bacterium]|nr:hypothetical protein [Pirellulales bacterium]